MVLPRFKGPALFFALACGVASACTPADQDGSDSPPIDQNSEQAHLRDALTFHASFDHGVDADFALGDPILYTAPTWDEPDQAQPGLGNPDVEIAPGLGRFGDALRFNRKNTTALFYRAEEKVAYSEEDWSGSVSFWLSLSPSEDLAPGYCDPIQITDQAYNDAAVWVDFTDADPRQFRLGVFGDLDAWNPERLSSDEHPGFEQGLVAVDKPPFRRGAWTHVVVSFSGLGSASGGSAQLYLDGHLQGTIQEIREPFSWELVGAQIRIGVNYVGLFDELALFDRALTEAEVKTLYQAEGGVVTLLR